MTQEEVKAVLDELEREVIPRVLLYELSVADPTYHTPQSKSQPKEEA